MKSYAEKEVEPQVSINKADDEQSDASDDEGGDMGNEDIFEEQPRATKRKMIDDEPKDDNGNKTERPLKKAIRSLPSNWIVPKDEQFIK